MAFLLAVAAIIAGILFWVLRAHGTVKQIREIDHDTKGFQRRARSTIEGIIGTPLQQVRDPRLAAVILMIQLVRTGSPVTASEKNRILTLMKDSLGVEDVEGTFERAWSYTEPRRPFSLAADPLLPLLREALTEAERRDLVDMLGSVAGAHSAPSELQREGIVRLKRRLIAEAPRLAATRSGDFG